MANQGVQRGRLSAVDTCRERHWGRNSVLRSDSWVADREVLQVGDRFVSMRYIIRGVGSKERVRSFPTDVRLVS